jgi:hypothetical protein
MIHGDVNTLETVQMIAYLPTIVMDAVYKITPQYMTIHDNTPQYMTIHDNTPQYTFECRRYHL